MRLGLCLIACLTAFAAMSPARALESRMIDNANDRWVEVSGEGSVSAAPDFARVTLGVTSDRKDRGRGDGGQRQSGQHARFAHQGGGRSLPPTSRRLRCQFRRCSRNPHRARQTAPTITGYSVSNNVTVIVRDIPRLGALLDKAVTAGANSVYGIGFGHNDPSALLDKARPLAVADARRKAEIYAGAGGARIGRLMALTEEGGPQAPVAFSRAYARWRPRTDTDRGGRGQADRHRHGAVRAHPEAVIKTRSRAQRNGRQPTAAGGWPRTSGHPLASAAQKTAPDAAPA